MLYRLSSIDALQVTNCESVIVKDSAAGDTLIIKVGNEAAVIAIRDFNWLLAYIIYVVSRRTEWCKVKV
jgi:hypothetical protein